MANYGLTLVTAPTWEPVTVSEAKKDCDLSQDSGYHDLRLKALIQAAREKVETDTGRALPAQTWDFRSDLFPCGTGPLYLPMPPLSSVTHVKYYDTNGDLLTFSSGSYKVVSSREPAEIWLLRNQSWPSLYGEVDVVIVRIVCGYATALAVPESLKLAMRLLVKSWFVGETENDSAYQALINKWLVGDEFHAYGRSVSYA